jgi:hypothetical protein
MRAASPPAALTPGSRRDLIDSLRERVVAGCLRRRGQDRPPSGVKKGRVSLVAFTVAV